jgi:hypothetical protein
VQLLVFTGHSRIRLDAEMNGVIGFAQEDLLKGKPESKLTNYLADLLLEESHRLSTHPLWLCLPTSLFSIMGVYVPVFPGEISPSGTYLN